MPFYEATGRDIMTMEPKSLQISARSEHEAIDTAAIQGITEIKLRPYSDREMLMLDVQCFLNAEPKSPARQQPQRIRPQTATKKETASDMRSLLLRHPLLTITTGVLLAIWIDRAATMLIAMI